MLQPKKVLPGPRQLIEASPVQIELLKALETVRQHLAWHADARQWSLPNDRVISVQLKAHKPLRFEGDLVPTIKFGGDWLRDAGFLCPCVRVVTLQGVIAIVPENFDYLFLL